MVENQNQSNKKYLLPLAIVIAGVLVAGAIIAVNKVDLSKLLSAVSSPQQTNNPQATPTPTPGENSPGAEALAKCLTEKGVKFYGAYWCGHCQNQKASFGSAAQYLPYIECVDKTTGQLSEVCKTAGIEAFPTWIFPDGTKQMGEIPLQELAQLAGCPVQ